MLPLEQRLEGHRAALLSQPFPGFGHAVKPFFGFDPSYVPLNNGSFGSCPNYVLDHYRELLAEAERWPDTFLRAQYQPLLFQARKQVADLVGCEVEDLVFVNNATSGVNVVLRGLNGTWEEGQAILVYETIYGACGQTAQYIVDSNPNYKLQIVKVALEYPITHDEVVAKTEAAIIDAESNMIKIRVGVVDAITSLPGVIVPWERICTLFRSHKILSLVDGAHAVGQIPLNLKSTDPDFFISNCHKWLFAHRGVAFLYTPKRNQHFAQAIPTSHDYVSPNLAPPTGPPLLSSDAPSNYVGRWDWTGTQDLSNYLTIPAALEFRRWLGGEEAIMNYNTTLALKAGQIVSTKLGKGSVVMEVDNPTESEKLTACMVNVSIPITTAKDDELAYLADKLQTRLMKENNTFVVFRVHAAKIWCRLSAQVWLQQSDFEWVADKIAQLVLEEEMQAKASI
ncbi:related to isopenicillin N epimerase [Melanopsichium pennsylvanicum]|uniref:Related to isopenicillin N epimerase n=2 Tax=Melanopsichium pennsylvanicum TaxID=63383 RepID=A0AAJ4XQA1_9BASI|nr:related to isopenicillin N epimerase [Melanopsichium pennsylvanicum]